MYLEFVATNVLIDPIVVLNATRRRRTRSTRSNTTLQLHTIVQCNKCCEGLKKIYTRSTKWFGTGMPNTTESLQNTQSMQYDLFFPSQTISPKTEKSERTHSVETTKVNDPTRPWLVARHCTTGPSIHCISPGSTPPVRPTPPLVRTIKTMGHRTGGCDVETSTPWHLPDGQSTKTTVKGP